MMPEKELIARLRQLRKIEPRRNWVFLTKQRIFSQEERAPIFSQILSIFRPLNYKPIFATFTILMVFMVSFALTKNSLPGDPLYLIKRVVEKSRAVFLSNSELAKNQIELANKRLEELTRIAQTNQVKKLAPALQEYQLSLAEAAKNIARVAATTSDSTLIKRIAGEVQKLEKNREILERTYGIAGLEPGEEASPTKIIVEWLIKDLETRTLTEEQQLLFDQAKEDYEAQDYNLSLEKILNLSQF